MGRSIEPKKRLNAWLTLSRPPFHAVGVFPFLLGMVIAWSQGYPFNWGVGILSTLAVILIMLTTYYAGEYYDYETDWYAQVKLCKILDDRVKRGEPCRPRCIRS